MQEPNLSSAAHLIADPTRAAMLTTLVDGRAYPAGDLADRANVTPQTASVHLSKLVDGGLINVEAQGRYRLYRLNGADVAFALETLVSLGVKSSSYLQHSTSKRYKNLRFARCCYNHLAGRVGVAIMTHLQKQKFISVDGRTHVSTSAEGVKFFKELGIDLASLKSGRRGSAFACLDWTEREYHLAGPLGAKMLDTFQVRRWAKRISGSREITFTQDGRACLRKSIGIDVDHYIE